MHKRTAVLVAVLVWASLWVTAASAKSDGGHALPAKYRAWLAEVSLLITPPERTAFLALREDARRDAFITAFWKARDPTPETDDNPFRTAYYARLAEAKTRFGGMTDDAAKVWILNGEPAERDQLDCSLALWPNEIWRYARTTRRDAPVTLLFYRPAGGPVLRLWHPEDGTGPLIAGAPTREPSGSRTGFGDETLGSDYSNLLDIARRYCGDNFRLLADALRQVQGAGKSAAAMAAAPPEPNLEWLRAFADRSTDLSPASTAARSPAAPEPLTADELQWLDDVALLLAPEERRAFLALPHAYQRRGFVEAFWAARDPDPRTPQNELRSRWQTRLATARSRWQSLTIDPAKVFLVDGEPGNVLKTDCNQNLWPLEIWHYDYAERSHRPFDLLFYRPAPGAGPFQLWRPSDGTAVLQRQSTPAATPATGISAAAGAGHDGDAHAFYERVEESWCPADAGPIVRTLRALQHADRTFVDAVTRPPPVDLEWLAGYRVYATDLAASAPALPVSLALDFPGREQTRTIVRGTLVVRGDSPTPARSAAPVASRAFLLTGEVLRNGALHESFRYAFEMPAPAPDGSYPLVFARPLRAGDFHLVLKLEEPGSGRAVRLERDVSVPDATTAMTTASAATSAGAAAAGLAGAAPFRLLPPLGDLVSGVIRLDADATDPRIAQVVFTLDGKPLVTRERPPWSVELRLGELPRAMRVRAVARDAAGNVLGADEVALNAPPHRLSVRLVEPREAAAVAPLRLRADLHLPPERTLDRLELFLDERKVATLWQQPWEVVVPALPKPVPTYARVVATLTDGTTAEDVVLLGGADSERGRVDVDTVEVYATALDAGNHPIQGLAASDFSVREDGRPQSVRRFQLVDELPLQVALLVDTSASMEDTLPDVQKAALEFFRDALRPADRAAVLTFSNQARLEAPLTGDQQRLAAALVGLRAEHSTALWDSLVFALHYLQGTSGRRALLVFSDGADRDSRFRFEQALAFAQHSGVAVYTISFGGAGTSLLEGRRRLARLAEETGGRSYNPRSVDELAATYRAIEEDLRSQYLLVYQSDGTGDGFRTIDVRVDRPGATVRTMRGYLP